MPDFCDMAQAAEEQARAAALSAHGTRRPSGGPVFVDEVPCCRECLEPIPAERLAALPGCGRCVACQEALDRDIERWR